MVNFIIPLQSKAVSRDWELVSKLCNQTIASILNQIDCRWRIFLICNEIPIGFEPHSQIHCLEIETTVPTSSKEKMIDKWIKIRYGLYASKKFGEGYRMIVDADDLLHLDFVSYINSQPVCYGFVVENGFVWDTGSRFIFKHNNLNAICGSTTVIWIDDVGFPNNVHDDSVPFLKWGHPIIKSKMASINRDLIPINFRCVVYRASTGENYSGIRYFPGGSKKNLINRLMTITLMSNNLKRNFSIF